MTMSDRRQLERAAQRQLIVDSARALAEGEGWDAVTTRRLAEKIEYSQPVIYKHFASLDRLVDAIAADGFVELTGALTAARADGAQDGAVIATAHAYLDWASQHPALYEAMFVRATRLPFAAEDTPAPLADAFAELRTAVEGVAGDRDVETLTEVVWAGLHGLAMLHRDGRFRSPQQDDRVRLLAALVEAGSS
jgi:AcrR family transcriptional regulator